MNSAKQKRTEEAVEVHRETGRLGPWKLFHLGSRGVEEEDRGTGAVGNRVETGAGRTRRTNAGWDMRENDTEKK